MVPSVLAFICSRKCFHLELCLEWLHASAFFSGIYATDYILRPVNVISYYQDGLKRELKVVFPEQQGDGLEILTGRLDDSGWTGRSVLQLRWAQ
jgi:hypothetical protein